MPIAVFKNKSFQVSSKKQYTFNELAWGGDLNTESQEKLDSKPSTYIKGFNLDTMSFTIQLKSSMGIKVRNEINEWESIKLDAEPGIFMLGTKPLGDNKWLLKSTNISDTTIDNAGNIIEATIKLDFEEYVRSGSAAASKKSKKKSTKTAAVNVGIKPANYIANSSDKSNQKRNNPNTKVAISKGTKKS